MAHERTSQLKASPPLFESRLLDFFSRVHPSVPALIYLPVIAAMAWLAADGGYGAARVAALLAVGAALWTLVEYALHRFVFHWQPPGEWGRRLHFIIHGVHHDHPNDKRRLVMPPAASIPLGLAFFGLYLLLFGAPAAYPLYGGLLLGYLAYDYTHYHVHHHTPKTRIGKRIRQNHMRHHFQDHRFAYGVTSPLWDFVFRTRPRSRSAD